MNNHGPSGLSTNPEVSGDSDTANMLELPGRVPMLMPKTQLNVNQLSQQFNVVVYGVRAQKDLLDTHASKRTLKQSPTSLNKSALISQNILLETVYV